MMRTQYKDAPYFAAYLEQQEQRIERFQTALQQIPAQDLPKRQQCQQILSHLYMDKLYASYSAGASTAALAAVFRQYLTCLREAPVSSFLETADLLSLTILLHIPAETVLPLLPDDAPADTLLQQLRHYAATQTLMPLSSAPVLLHPDYETTFLTYLLGQTSLDALQDYMRDQWYASCGGCAFYQAHLRPDATYVGYWCWLAAAVLHIRGVHPAEAFPYTPLLDEATP